MPVRMRPREKGKRWEVRNDPFSGSHPAPLEPDRIYLLPHIFYLNSRVSVTAGWRKGERIPVIRLSNIRLSGFRRKVPEGT